MGIEIRTNIHLFRKNSSLRSREYVTQIYGAESGDQRATHDHTKQNDRYGEDTTYAPSRHNISVSIKNNAVYLTWNVEVRKTTTCSTGTITISTSLNYYMLNKK